MEITCKKFIIFVLWLLIFQDGVQNDSEEENDLEFLTVLFQRLYCSRILVFTQLQKSGKLINKFSRKFLMSTIYKQKEIIKIPNMIKNSCVLLLCTQLNIDENYQQVLKNQWLVIMNKNRFNLFSNFTKIFGKNIIIANQEEKMHWDIELYSPVKNHLVGQWNSKRKKLNLFQALPLKNQLEIENHPIKFGVVDFPPTMEIINTNSSESLIITGFVGELVHVMSSCFNLNFTYVIPEDGQFGSFYKRYQNWTGIMAKLITKEANVGAAMTWTPDRRKYVDFSSFLYKVPYKILYRRWELKLNWLFYVTPFCWRTWICVLALNVVVLLSIHCAELNQIHSFYDGSFTSLLWPISSNSKIPMSIPLPSRIFILSFFICSIILFSSYTSVLTALLAIEEHVIPFVNLEDMLGKKEYFPVLIRGTSFTETFSAAESEPYKTAWRLMLKNRDYSFVDEFEEGINVVYTKKAGFITAVKDVFHLIESNCSFAFSPQDVRPIEAALAYTKSFPYQEIMNIQILKLRERGILTKFSKTYFPNLQPCGQIDTHDAVSLNDVFFLFILLTCAILLSVQTSILEIIINKKTTK